MLSHFKLQEISRLGVWSISRENDHWYSMDFLSKAAHFKSCVSFHEGDICKFCMIQIEILKNQQKNREREIWPVLAK